MPSTPRKLSIGMPPGTSSFSSAAAGATKASRQPNMEETMSPFLSPSALLSTTTPMAPPCSASPIWNGGT